MKNSEQEKMYCIIEEWQKDKISKAEICRRYNISRSRFFYWLYKYQKKDEKNGKQEKFIPIEVIKPIGTIPQIKIVYPNQVTVIIDNNHDLNFIKQLINII